MLHSVAKIVVLCVRALLSETRSVVPIVMVLALLCVAQLVVELCR